MDDGDISRCDCELHLRPTSRGDPWGAWVGSCSTGTAVVSVPLMTVGDGPPSSYAYGVIAQQ